MTNLNKARALLMPALGRCGGTHDWQDIVDGITSTRMQLWSNDDAAAITEIVKYPRKTVLNVFLAGGDMGHLMEMLDSAKEWGKLQGCEAITMSGRKGWLRVLDKHGWHEQFVTMSCPNL